MKLRLATPLLLFVLVCLSIVSAWAGDRESCESLSKQNYANVTIVSSVFMSDPLGFIPPKTPGVFSKLWSPFAV
jgi:hypothetical protein